MIFGNPWAWLGLVAMAGPIVAHLLARRPSRRQPFPTLRFVPSSALRPVRRGRISDAGLLAVRCAIIAAAVIALAQPIRPGASRERLLQNRFARAIIVDASASMSRRAIGGNAVIDDARRVAAAMASESAFARVVETPTPSRALGGALTWLATQPARREVVIVSDFQPAALGQVHVDRIPAEIGFRPVPVPADQVAVRPEPAPSADRLRLLAAAAERPLVEAAREAVLAIDGPASAHINRPVALAFPGYEGRGALLAASRPIDEPWMFELFHRVMADPTLQTAFDRIGRAPSLRVSQAVIDGRDHLLLETTEPAHALATAATIRAIGRAASTLPANEEADPTVLTATALRAWERPAAPAPTTVAASTDTSRGRYVWILVLALLGVEHWQRRARRMSATEAPHARVA